MNIFYLDRDPVKAAQYHSDKHVVKMILESAQLLSTAHRVLDGQEVVQLNAAGARMKRYILNDEREQELYKSTHVNHPSAIWVRESAANYNWLVDMLKALMEEYTYRYGKHHATERLLPYLEKTPNNIKVGVDFTQPTPAMDSVFTISDDGVANYRNYYTLAKSELHAYTKREWPTWLRKVE